MERWPLSDWRTFAWKYVVPLFLVGPLAWLTALLLIGRVDWNGGPAPWFVRCIALAGLAAVAVLVRAVVGSLKRVRADGEAVYVSNYFQPDEAIPRAQIASLLEHPRVKIGGERPIKVELREEWAGLRSFSFFLARGLTYEDVEESLGLPVLWQDERAARGTLAGWEEEDGRAD